MISREQYLKNLREIDRIFFMDEFEDRLKELVKEVREYEEVNFPMEQPLGTDILSHLLEANSISLEDIAKEVGKIENSNTFDHAELLSKIFNE